MLKSFFQSIIIALILALSGFAVVTAAPQFFEQAGNSFGTTATLGTNDNFPLAIETNGTEKVRINTAGDVGVGTTTPGTKLDVVGTLRSSGLASFLAGVDITCTGCITDLNIVSTLTNKILSTGSTWSGNTIGTSVGGTGLNSIGTSNQVLGVDNAGSGLEYKTVSGTTNQVNITFSPGSMVLSLPQDIHFGAAPTFAGLTSNGQVESTSGGFKFPDGTIQTTAATPAPTPPPPPAPTTSLFAQAISPGNLNYQYQQIASKYNSGDVLWAVLTGSDTGGILYIERYARDATGHYYRTHSIAPADRNTNGKPGIALIGDYVYVNFEHSATGQYRVYRYLASDLTGEVLMTIIGPPDDPPFTSDNNKSFADADDLYLFNWRDNNHFRYTITDTTITNVGIIITNMGAGGYWSDDTNIFVQSGGDIRKRDFSGGAIIEYGRGLQYSVPASDPKPRGLVYATSTAIYLIYWGQVEGSPLPTHSVAWLIPITKP